MRIINLLINENLLNAELALSKATADNVVSLCRNYLRLLTEYRDHLRDFRDIPEINLAQTSSLSLELTNQARKAIRAAVEITVREYNQAEALLESFISITNYQAAETFNQLEYKGAVNWTASSAGVHRSLSNGIKETTKFRLAAASGAAVGANESVIRQTGPAGSHSAGPGIEHLSLESAHVSETVEQLTSEEAVDTAGCLRREAYVNHKITFLK
jgi:hypothetical protein